MARMKPVLGIDFGTTNTSAAWVDRKANLHMVPVTEVDHVLPSVVWYASRDRFVVGAGARQKIVDDPQNTVFGLKRFLGRQYRSEFVTRNKDRHLFKIVEGPDGTCAAEVHGEVKSLTTISFNIIHRIVELANAAAGAGQEFEECVLTVPAHFGYRQRQIVRTAAEMAGLEVRAMINEPTAAALYYTRSRGGEQTLLVFDLGGGTFDATLIAIEGHLVKVLATGGDAFLGGAGFDERIAGALARRFQNDYGIDLSSQKVVMQRLIFASELAKIILSSEERANVRVVFAGEKNGRPIDLDYAMNREMLEQMIAPLIERCVGACEELLARKGLKASDVGELILVGGQTRTPALQRRLQAVFRTDPAKNINPELSVAAGAAMLGRSLDMPAGPGLVDVVSVPIWMMVPGKGPMEAIGANTAVPCARRMPIENRPPPGMPLALVLYEALEAASVDREILGSVRVEADWLALNPGPLELEVKMTQSFSLEISAHAGPAIHPLDLVAPRPAQRR
ncbi:MAG: Hsp70 family protein [Myxococcota bacterium]